MQKEKYHHGNLRKELIYAGLDLLVTERMSINSLSLRKVAQKVGVSPAAPYRHFKNKESLISGIADEGAFKLYEQLKQAIVKFPDNPREQIIEMGWQYVQFGLNNPNLLRVMFGGILDRERLQTQDSFNLLKKSIEKGIETGQLISKDEYHMTMAAWSLVHGFTILSIENPIPDIISDSIIKEELARVCFSFLFIGFDN